MEKVKVTYLGKSYMYPKDITLEDISKDFQENYSETIIMAEVNGRPYELNYKVTDDVTVDFFDLTSPTGNRVYESGLIFVLEKACLNMLNSEIEVKYSIDKGIYIKTYKKITKEDLDKVSREMKEIVKRNLPIQKNLVNRLEAIEYYKSTKSYDKVNVLKYSVNTNVNLYRLMDIYNYFFSYLPVSTGALKEFKLTYIDQNSFVLRYPNIYYLNKIPVYKHHDKLFNEFKKYDEWSEKLGIENVSSLNNKVTKGNVDDIVLLSENIQNNSLFKIAETIYNNKKLKLILLAGPSSSGKTTTSKKLELFLKGFGLNPIAISIDNYFVDRDKTPRLPDGSYDFESLNSINVELFNKNLKDLLDGKEVNFSGPKDALENGIAMVHQELNQCLERNVVDNLFLGRYPVNSLGVIDEKRMKNEASKLFRKLGMTVNLDQPMRNMSVSQRQMCEIAKAISYNSKVIVLDEPTSSLTVQEVEKLFEMMRMLRDQGISLIYISHKMDEIFEICDEISVLRDGNLVMTKSAKETDMNELIAAMVGRVLENRFPPVDNQPKDVVLSVQHLSTKFEPYLQDVSFDVREGEIFGLYGLVGAGRTELLETIFGIRTRASGRVYLNNKLMNFSCAKEAMDYGFALITEERKANGLFLKGDLTFNTTIANLHSYKSGAAISDSKMVKATANEIKVMHTKCMGPGDMISSLSGGNQQKVIFGRWLERSPQVFMMDEPTRGIDVGAKYEIYDLIIKMAKEGKTIIVVSSEMPEILGITNRIGVMSNGHLSGIVNTKETNQEELLRLSAKYL